METPATMTPAIRTWWYPADGMGFEFVYPKRQARALAKDAGQQVLTTRAQTTTAAETKTDDLTRIAPTGRETSVDPSAKAEPSTPSGRVESGEIASPTLVIPANPVPTEP